MNKIIIPLILIFLISCEEQAGDSGNFTYDKERLLTDMADGYIIPSYQSFDDIFQKYLFSFEDFKNQDNSPNFNQLRADFITLTNEWQKIAFLDFGPAKQNQLKEEFNIYPIDIEQVEDNINSSEEVNLSQGNNIDARGLPAIEYILLSNGYDEISEDQLAYLSILNSRLSEKFNAAYNSWTSSFRAEFIENTSNDGNSSLSIVFNTTTEYFERHLRDNKLGIPLGIRSSGIPNPAWIENPYSGESWNNLSLAFQYYVEFIRNGEDYGFIDLIQESNGEYQGEKLHKLINQEFDNCIELLSNKPNNFVQDLELTDQNLNNIFASMQNYVTLLKVPVTQAIGIQITYLDNDGD